MNRRSLIAGLVATPIVMKADRVGAGRVRQPALLCVSRRPHGHVPGQEGFAGRFAEGADQADRGAQFEDQLHHLRALRSGTEGGSTVRRSVSARRRKAARRDDGRHQGRIQSAGLADDAGLAHLQGLAARNGKRSRHRLARGGWRCHVVPDDGAGILPLPRRLDPRLGHDP